MNLQNKHIATYGTKTDGISFYSYHCLDNLFHKSTITASAKAAIVI